MTRRPTNVLRPLALLVLAGFLVGPAESSAQPIRETGQDVNVARLLEDLRNQISQDRHAKAARTLGQLLQGDLDFLSPVSSVAETWTDGLGRVDALWQAAKPQTRREHEAIVGKKSRAAFKAAMDRKDLPALQAALRRFRFADASRDALLWLAEQSLQAGRPFQAAACCRQLRRIHPAEVAKQEPRISLLHATALVQANLSGEAERVLLRLHKTRPGAVARFGDRDVKLFAKPSQALHWLRTNAGPAITRREADAWTMRGGDPARSAAGKVNAPLLQYAWRIHTSNDQPKLEPIVKQLRQEFQNRRRVALPALHPLAVSLDLREVSRITSIHSVRDWNGFLDRLKTAAAKPDASVEKHLWNRFSAPLRAKLKKAVAGQPIKYTLKRAVIDELNALLARRDFYEPTAWDGREHQRREALDFLERGLDNLGDDEIHRLNRLLLESVFRKNLTMSSAHVVLMRTFDNLMAIDFVTGKRMWEVSQDDEKNQLTSLVRAGGVAGQRATDQANSLLTERLWRDATFGSLASDGKKVFAIEDLALRRVQTIHGVFVLRPRKKSDEPKDYNRLAAYEVRTGKLKWELGGAPGEGQLDLAGTFFLGAPLPLGEQLFVLGEKQGEVSLHVLDAASGTPVGSRTLGLTEKPILQDPRRGLLGATPSYRDGLLICSTTLGTVLAVDPADRSIRWAYRFPPPEPSSPDGSIRQPLAVQPPGAEPPEDEREDGFFGKGGFESRRANLFGREPDPRGWVGAPPLIANDRVFLAEDETQLLHCLNLADGTSAWKHHHPRGRFVAAARGGKIVIIEDRRAVARDVATGKIAWSLDLGETQPSGQGFHHDGIYHLPTSSRGILQIDLATGTIADRVRATDQRTTAAGNIIPFRGTIISQGVDYAQRLVSAAVRDRELEAKLQRNPNDHELLLRRGMQFVREGQINKAIADLRRAL
ncbi:MAG: PQQ-binding-like beta-propeller repeat protein, partial [Planctomycetales bacterium]